MNPSDLKKLIGNRKVVWKAQPGQALPFLVPWEVREILLTGPRGGGKRLADRSKVLTNQGWIQAGEVTKEHQLVAPDGTYTNVLGIYKRATGPLYKVTCNDGASVVVDEEHNWSVSKNLILWEVRTTQEMIDSPGVWFLPLAKAPPGVEYIGVSPYEHREVTSIERVADGPGTCFEVDHPSHQFICEDFIVTHNTTCLFAAWQRGIGLGMGLEWKGMIFKRTNTEVLTLGDEAKKFFLALDPNVKCTTHPYYTFVWPTGEKLTLRHMADVNDYDGIHGSQLTFIGWEELTNWGIPDVYLKCMSLLRSSDPMAGKMSQVWATTNPGQIGNQWVRDRWQLPQMMHKIISENNADSKELERWSRDKLVMQHSGKRIAINLDVRNNKALLDVVPDYLAQIAAQATSEAQRRQWLDGDWTTTAGGMFNDLFHFKYHIFDRFPIPHGWTISRAMDWGSSTPFSVLWYAVSNGSDFVDAQGQWRSSVRGDVFITHEWYGSSGGTNKGVFLTATEVAKGIVEREMEWEIYKRVVPGPADNQITTQFQAGQSIARDMRSPIRLDNGQELPGIEWTRSDKNSGGGTRITGWNLIRDRLKRALPEQNLKSPRELPSLFFFHDLADLIKHLPNTPRDDKVIDDVPKRGEFHIQDVIRYIILDQGNEMSQGPVVGLH